MKNILSAADRNSVECLSTITRAIYVMKSSIDGAYRFGAVGVNGQNNTALARLSKCLDVNNGVVMEYFTYA